MEYLYDDLVKSQEIPNAYERWSEYRGAMTDLILAQSKGCKKIGILGAGVCNDIALDKLIESGKQVILYDCNEDFMKKGVRLQFGEKADQLFETRQIVCAYCNVWPVSKEEYYQLEQLFLQQTSMGDILDWIDDLTRRIWQKKISVPETCEYLTALGLHSQTTVIFIALLKQYLELGLVYYSDSECSEYYDTIAMMNQKMVAYVQAWIEACSNHVLYGYEYSVFESEKQLLQAQLLLVNGQMNELANMRIGRVEGAYQLEQLIGTYYSQKKLLINQYAVTSWPFLESKKFLMVLYECLLK